MRLAVGIALRDLRGGLRGLYVVLACLALGVAAIAAVGSLRASIDRGLAANGRALLGGDVAIETGAEPPPNALRAWAAQRGARISTVTLLRTLAVAPGGDRMLVELKAVDTAYPLAGETRLTPPQPLQQALRTGIAADPLVLQRLNLAPGAALRLGNVTLPISAALTKEPDHATGAAILGPRILISDANLARTSLVQPGSLVTHEARLLLPPNDTPQSAIAALRTSFPDTGWRLRDPAQAAANLEQAITQTSLFLTLVGLSALLVGGIGVATGVRAWLEGRARTIATLRCLGASAATVFTVFLTQIMLLCLAGVALGVVAGATLTSASLWAFGDALPIPAENGLYTAPLVLAALYGLLTAASFSLWPLGRAAQISGAALFRDATLPDRGARPVLAAANAILIALLAAVIIVTSPDRLFALRFCLATLLTLAVFRAGAFALQHAARRLTPRTPAWLRLGWTNLGRPASPAPLLLVSLGLGLATLATVTLIEANIDAQFTAALPANAPSFFFIDIQNDQLATFEKLVSSQGNVTDLHSVPSLRARVVALNGVPAETAQISPDTRWAIRGDRGLTYAAHVPEGSRIVAGAWWTPDYAGPPLISLDEGLARGWNLHVGDTIRLNVLGRDLDFRVASLRAIDWRALTLNFTMVASPGLLEHAPQMHIATLREPAAQDARLLRVVTDALPNVTGIRVADVLAAVAELVAKLAAALSAAGAVTLASGALVLAGAVAAGQRRRMAEAVVLKTLGASRAQIRAAWLVEFGVLGAAAGVIACGLGTLASWAAMRFVMHAPWSFMPGRLAGTVGACVAAALVFGWVGTEAALRVRAAGVLRNE
jgi:putative ABC transport system permease protein